jgi:TRAP-type C4-dicarboxylate transport system substrate-binding protein
VQVALLLISNEAFERYLKEIREQIDQLDKETKKKTDNTLRAVYDNYYNQLNDRIANELAQAEKNHISGNNAEASRHLALANIFKSILENHVTYGPVTKTAFAQDSPSKQP